jgi:hypothetical protein
MRESYLSTALKLRLLVGYLGERAQFAWWPTAFYDPSSRPFLEPAFSKTSRLAQYHGVMEAARRLHDEHLSVGSYHLFRLPEEVEQDLHAILQGAAGEKLAAQALQGKDAALEALQGLAAKRVPLGVGPTAIGSIKDLESTDTLTAIAGVYVSAFSHDAKAYPYLVGYS